jgi:hypothetical protein
MPVSRPIVEAKGAPRDPPNASIVAHAHRGVPAAGVILPVRE